jgi:hypothetical protein
MRNLYATARKTPLSLGGAFRSVIEGDGWFVYNRKEDLGGSQAVVLTIGVGPDLT